MNIACCVRNETVFEQVRTSFVRAGFEHERFTSEAALFRAIRRREYDFIVVDITGEFREDESIFSWLQCRSGDSTPVLAMSPAQSGEFVAHVLTAGADDYVARPFEGVELIARIRAILRRCKREQVRRCIELAGFVLDRETSTFSYAGTPIELTPREFTMAWLFFSSPGVYISRETIGTAIWGTNSEIAGRTIEQHVYKLRKKLQLGAARGVMIRTAYSQGYRLELCGQALGTPA